MIKKLNVYHLILGNDDSEECNKYNEYTYKFIGNVYNTLTDIRNFDKFRQVKKRFKKIARTIIINKIYKIPFNKIKDMMRDKIIKLNTKEEIILKKVSLMN